MKVYFVYILASSKNGTLYTGVTNNLLRRVNGSPQRACGDDKCVEIKVDIILRNPKFQI